MSIIDERFQHGETVRFIHVGPPAWVLALRALLRWLYTVAVIGGGAWLVFYRGESGWIFLPVLGLMIFRRGL